MQKRFVWIVLAALVLGIAAYLYWKQRPPEPGPPPPPPVPAEAREEPAIRHPIPEVQPPPPEPLPPLDASDPSVRESMTALVGPQGVQTLGLTEDLIRRLVTTIDNLPRQKVAPKVWPVGPTAGRFLTAGDEEHPVLSPENYARYEPLVRLIGAIPAQRLAGVYFRYYPLFQEAYEDLGYPTGYFNDRLVQVIDHLLATPEIEGPIALARPNVFYEYAAPGLEARSAGQKLLLRMGPANAAIVKQTLRELRGEIVEHGVPDTS